MHGTELYVEEIERLRGENARLKEENEALHKDGMLVYSMLNSKEVERLKSELANEKEAHKLAAKHMVGLSATINELSAELAKAREERDQTLISHEMVVDAVVRRAEAAEARVKELEDVDRRNAELIEERDQYKLALSETKDGLAECVHEDPKAFNRGYVKGMEEGKCIIKVYWEDDERGMVVSEVDIFDLFDARIAEIKQAAESKEEKG